MTYDEKVADVKVRYASRILAFLEKARKCLKNNKFVCEDIENDITEYRWMFNFKNELQKFTFMLVISESDLYEGTEDGINFYVVVFLDSGKDVAVFKPYKDTDQQWVSLDDPEAIEKRWKVIEGGYNFYEDLLPKLDTTPKS